MKIVAKFKIPGLQIIHFMHLILGRKLFEISKINWMKMNNISRYADNNLQNG